MALLARDPARRMSGAEALNRLGAVDANAGAHISRARSVFVGRTAALAALSTALGHVRQGRNATVMVYGPSGIGKSFLVQHFIETEAVAHQVLTLRSRCHEHEAIPYKGFDGLIDGVTQHLLARRPSELAEVLPPDADALATLFPVMRMLGLTPAPDSGDPVQLRRKAFDAFRTLLENLGRRQPLLVEIDDFHWADADSVAWLTALLRPPGPRSLLTIVSFRSQELEAKPFLRTLIERVDIGDRLSLAMTPMSDTESQALVAALGSPDQDAHAAIARASGGNPFLIEALTRHAASNPVPRDTVSIEEMLARRIDMLPAEAASFLDALAVCGRPVLPVRIFEACGSAGDDRPLVARLCAEHLIRRSRTADRVELYHDRIREVLASRIPPAAARTIHDLLARTLVAHGDDDPEALFEHYRAAGHTARAADQAATAAQKATDVLAFDLAVTFYRHALGLEPNATQAPAWTLGLAGALEKAGRPVEAADAYLRAADDAPAGDQLSWRRKAAELLLIGGQIDRGLSVSRDVLDAVGMRLARGPKTAIASLTVRRLQLAWRGLDFTPREESQIPHDDLLRIDAAWAISAGLAMVDPIRAAAFNVRQLLRALDVGDAYRIARAMALEAGFSVVGVGAGLQRSESFSRQAEQLAAHAGQHYVAALTMLWEGIAAFLTGQWKKASDLCGRAATILREECTGVIWELNMAHNFFLGGLVAQGELREASRHLPALLASAHERGNFYLELELRTRMILVWLAADEADAAERRGNEGIALWSQSGFQRQHYGHMLMRVQADLYRGRPREAWQLIESCQRPLRRSLFLRVQHTRIERAIYRARCALAMAAAGIEETRMRAIACREAARLASERRPWSDAVSRLVLATVAHGEGRLEPAADQLAAAVAQFEISGMQLYAATARRRLGAIVGGDEGRRLRTESDAWMAAQEVRDVEAMTRVLAPGFPD
jgi:hypothetical protein